MRIKSLLFMILLTCSKAGTAPDNQVSTPEIDFTAHHFSPLSLTVPAGRPLKIKVVNQSKETIEFESFSLNRETVVEPGQSITVRLPALSPGSYDFYDDFHQDVPEGSIVAK
jgi:hypothetical protein